MKAEDIRELLEHWPGQIDLEDELPCLHRLVSALEPGQVYFEIGTGAGRSALIAALSARDGVEIWTIDNARRCSVEDQTGYIKAILSRFAYLDVLHKARFYPLSSDEMPWDGETIDILFIDGDHSPVAVQVDINNWTPFVPVGGVIAFHDAIKGPWKYYKGVVAAVARLLETGDWAQEQGARSIAVLRRVR